ncbi:hypothetical protein D3C87_1045290 [compost metagenome]
MPGIGRDHAVVAGDDREDLEQLGVGAREFRWHGERGFGLGGEDAFGRQRAQAIPVEGLGEEPFAGADGIRRVDEDDVVRVGHLGHEGHGVTDVNGDPRIAQGARDAGEPLAGLLDDHAVDLAEVDMGHAGVAQDFANRSSVPAADHQHPFGGGMGRHGNVCDHLVVDELVAFGGHDQAVERQHAAVIVGVQDGDVLELGLPLEEGLLHLEGQAGLAVLLGIPEVHRSSC